VTEFLRAKGYDSIYMKDRGYFVAFDGRQVATYSAEPFTQQQVNDISAARRASVGTWDDVNARAAASSTGAALGGLDSTEPAYDRPSDDDLFEF
jgi:hypothetical protein